MSDMKCPICNDGKIIAYLDGTYECDNHECSIYNGTHTETFEALIRTRKALDEATKCINWVIDTFQKGLEHESDVVGCCELSLERIEELEQKDIK